MPTTGLEVVIFVLTATNAGCVVLAPGVLLVTEITATGATTAAALGFIATNTGGAFMVMLNP
jgi:hypothetical protein